MKVYNEKTFAIDLIIDYFKTRNIVEIKNLAYSELGVDLKLTDVVSYRSANEDLEKESYLIDNHINTNEEEYEWNAESGMS